MTDIDQFRRWNTSAQEQVADSVKELQDRPWRPFYCPRVDRHGVPNCDGQPHKGVDGKDWEFRHARGKQHPPKGDWLTWLILGGRGSGKTRGGAEYIQRLTRVAGRIALISPTGPDVRDVLVEGDSGILATSPPERRPVWEPSKRKLTWANGATAFAYSAEEPDRLRGPQFHAAWLDEPAHMPLIEDVWSNLLFGLRLGTNPRICCTTTPLPIPWLKNLLGRQDTQSVIMPTYDNLANLPEAFAKTILARYEGTRKGRQEIMGELLADVEGALWDSEDIQRLKREDLPEMKRIVVSIDPAGSANAKSDETGIIVVGTDGSDFYVLEDASGKFRPNVWAKKAVGLVEKWNADYIVAERNYGGDMVKTTLDAASEDNDLPPRVVTVNSRRGKTIRADPIVALYERRKVYHVEGLGTLEDQQVGWVPGDSSPDRLDAVVHGITDLARTVAPATVASPLDLNLRMPIPGVA